MKKSIVQPTILAQGGRSHNKAMLTLDEVLNNVESLIQQRPSKSTITLWIRRGLIPPPELLPVEGTKTRKGMFPLEVADRIAEIKQYTGKGYGYTLEKVKDIFKEEGFDPAKWETIPKKVRKILKQLCDRGNLRYLKLGIRISERMQSANDEKVKEYKTALQSLLK